MKLRYPIRSLLTLLLLLFTFHANAASFISKDHPIAIFDFREKGVGPNIEGSGEKVAAMLYAYLSTDPGILLVDREELDRIESEILLSMSGVVNSSQAVQVGQMTGAKILVTGTLFELDASTLIVAKVIGVETSRVIGVHVQGPSDGAIIDLAQELADKIIATVDRQSDALVAPQLSTRDRMADIALQLADKRKPSISVKVPESHISRRSAPDPAAETELLQYLISAGFNVIDANSDKAQEADLALSGEGVTEFATRKGDLVGVRGRVEVRVIDNQTKQVVAVDRQTEIELNLSEVLAGKNALQRAAAKIAERLLPQLATEDK